MRPTTRRGRGPALTAGLAAVALLAGCSGAGGYDDPTPRPGPGWSTATCTDHGGLAVPRSAPADPEHLWERAFGAPVNGSAARGVGDQGARRPAAPGRRRTAASGPHTGPRARAATRG